MVDVAYNPTQPNHIYLICMFKQELALNNPEGLICHNPPPNQTIAVGIRRFIPSTSELVLLAWLELQLIHFYFTVLHVSYYAMATADIKWLLLEVFNLHRIQPLKWNLL